MEDKLRRPLRRWWRVLIRWGHEALYTTGLLVGFNVPKLPREARDVPLPRDTRLSVAMRAHLARAYAVEIETRRSPTVPAYRAAIRVVVDGAGQVYASPAEGTSAYWYRRILINPGVTFLTGAGPVYVRAVPQNDGRTMALVLDLYQRKYGRDDPGTIELLRSDPKRATVRFELF